MFKNKSVLYRYMASFVSLAMLCCVVIGTAGYLLAAKEMRQSAAAEQQKRLQLAAEDMCEQFDHLEEISHYVMTTAVYAPSYFSRNPYYELELLEDLAKQRTYTSIFDHLFLRYEESPFIYTMTGKSWLKVYERTLLLTEDEVASLPAFLDQIQEPTFYSLRNGTIAVFPIRFARTSTCSGRATISFYMTQTALMERIQLISSENFTRMAMFYQDQCVMQTAQIEEPISVQHGDFTLVFDLQEIGGGMNNHFLHLSLRITFVFAALLCTLAIYVAVRNFRPIGNLARRHNLTDGSNEIEHLDKTLNDMQGKLRFSQEQLDAHMSSFKALRSSLHHYFVAQMIRGETDDRTLECMRETGMHFPGEKFYAYILRLSAKKHTDSLEQSIEELTDDNAAFFIAPFGGENSYAVVANASEDTELTDILRDACPEAQVFGGQHTETLSEIPSLLFDALTATSPSCIKPSDIARCREDERLRTFRKALETGDETQALTSLNEYAAAYTDGDETLKQLIHSNIISTLLSASYEVNMNVPHAFLRGKYESWSLLEGWVSAVCGNRENVVSENEEHQILRYLRENALDYNLSLERVAEYFHRSTRQITRIIQNETGGSYKEFVLRLRMEHAKEMLAAGCSVSDTCEKVCYISRSHFIKTFTTYTGMTPSRYRDSLAQQPAQEG